MSVLKKIILSLIKSAILSAFIFVTGYSLLTQQFPPRLDRFKNFYDQLVLLNKLSQNNQSIQRHTRSDMGYVTTGDNADADIEELKRNNMRLANLGNSLGDGAAELVTEEDQNGLTKPKSKYASWAKFQPRPANGVLNVSNDQNQPRLRLTASADSYAAVAEKLKYQNRRNEWAIQQTQTANQELKNEVTKLRLENLALRKRIEKLVRR